MLRAGLVARRRALDQMHDLGHRPAARLGPVVARHALQFLAQALTRIRALPGVVDVLSARDIPGPNDCGALLHDDPILAGEAGTTVDPAAAGIVFAN